MLAMMEDNLQTESRALRSRHSSVSRKQCGSRFMDEYFYGDYDLNNMIFEEEMDEENIIEEDEDYEAPKPKKPRCSDEAVASLSQRKKKKLSPSKVISDGIFCHKPKSSIKNKQISGYDYCSDEQKKHKENGLLVKKPATHKEARAEGYSKEDQIREEKKTHEMFGDGKKLFGVFGGKLGDPESVCELLKVTEDGVTFTSSQTGSGSPSSVAHPIHDQCFYLTLEPKRKLKAEYGVEPWTFEQWLGEAVFIPAGCPRQVRNPKSCTKVAVDFVSPENLSECIRFTEEFRKLPKNHRGREDKLEIKKMIIHGINQVIKDLEELISSRKEASMYDTVPPLKTYFRKRFRKSGA